MADATPAPLGATTPPTPYCEDDRATLYRADALAVLRELPTASVDALITDPPYSSGGFVRGDRMRSTGDKYSSAEVEKTADFTGDNRDQRSFLTWMNLWLHESQRVMKPGAVLALFTDWRQLPTMTDAMQVGGYMWRGIVPWYKPMARPQVGRFTASCEYVVWGSNGPMELDYHSEVGALPGFYQANAPRDREHQTQKPLSVMRALCKIVAPDGVILDPFAGSGTTGVAALIEGRRFVGCELSEHYAQVAANRLRSVARGYRDDGGQMALLEDGGAS